MDYYTSVWPESNDYRVTVTPESGHPMRLLTFSAHQHQPGSFNYESELETFAQWRFLGRAQVKVEVLNGDIRMEEVAVRPRRAGIFPVVSPADRCVYFAIDTAQVSHRLLSVEIGGRARPCFLFTDPPEREPILPTDPGVRLVPQSTCEEDVLTESGLLSLIQGARVLYFERGVYNLETFTLRADDLTLYLEPGALLRLREGENLPEHNHANVRNAVTLTGRRLRILGQGVLDCKVATDRASKPLTCHGNVLCLQDCQDVTVEGLTFTHSLGFCLVALRSEDVQVRHVKMAGSQDMTSNDGILMDGSRRALIEQCFANNHDDALEVKTHHYAKGPCEHVVFQDCLVWNRGGMCLAAAWENWWDIRDVTWRRISVIHHENYGNGALCVYTGNRGKISGLLFEDIDVEDTPFGGIAVTVEEHPWCYWGADFAVEAVGEAARSTDPNDNWSELGDIHFKNIRIRHSEGFDSDFYPRPKPPGNGNGHGGRGYKLHVPMPEFSSGKTTVKRPHLTGTITFENVYIETYRDHQSFSRFGQGEPHDAGRPIPGHYLTDLRTDNWILWEGVNPQLWELIPGREAENVYTSAPDEEEHRRRLEFWEKRIRFVVK